MYRIYNDRETDSSLVCVLSVFSLLPRSFLPLCADFLHHCIYFLSSSQILDLPGFPTVSHEFPRRTPKREAGQSATCRQRHLTYLTLLHDPLIFTGTVQEPGLSPDAHTGSATFLTDTDYSFVTDTLIVRSFAAVNTL